MDHSHHDIALENFDATGEAEFLRVFVPLVEDVEFLVGGGLNVFHAGDDFDGAGSAGTIEAAGFHFDAGGLTGVEEESAGIDLGGLATGE
jgi:hypothetical protein